MKAGERYIRILWNLLWNNKPHKKGLRNHISKLRFAIFNYNLNSYQSNNEDPEERRKRLINIFKSWVKKIWFSLRFYKLNSRNKDLYVHTDPLK